VEFLDAEVDGVAFGEQDEERGDHQVHQNRHPNFSAHAQSHHQERSFHQQEHGSCDYHTIVDVVVFQRDQEVLEEQQSDSCRLENIELLEWRRKQQDLRHRRRHHNRHKFCSSELPDIYTFCKTIWAPELAELHIKTSQFIHTLASQRVVLI
jgi:hypothetical protein